MTQNRILIWIWAWRMRWKHRTAFIQTVRSICKGKVTMKIKMMNTRNIRRRRIRMRRRMRMRMIA